MTEGRFLLEFQLRFEPKAALQEGDTLRFSFRDLFSDDIASCERPVPELNEAGEARLQVLPVAINRLYSQFTHTPLDTLADLGSHSSEARPAQPQTR